MEKKVFNDPVHGQIKIPALCIRIIDTPQFQRLRRIQQLGGVSYVYYGATHTRFEHSIGVCHLAGALLEHLRKEQGLEIDENDILCVQVAGLCRDLGHGPFSHLWEKTILEKLGHPDVKHESLSAKMFKHLVKENKLKEEFKKHLKLPDSDSKEITKELKFIRELIKGVKNKNGAWEMKGREEHKAFLYDIISNKENGIDVDKWDDFARDCYYLGVKSSFDHLRLMNSARVLKVTDERQVEICHISYRDKAASDVYGLFYTRNILHQKAYQHKTVKAVECMLSDVILSVKELLTFQVEDDSTPPRRVTKTLKVAIGDLDLMAYELLDDTVISRIKQMDPEIYGGEQKTALTKAQDLIKRLEKREIYRCFPSAPIDAGKVKDLDKEKIETLKDEFLKNLGGFGLQKDDFDFDIVTYDYGMMNENPVDKVYFYEKSNPDIPKKIPKNQVSMMLPETFSESRLLVLLKKPLSSEKEFDFKTKFEHFCKASFTSCSEEQAVTSALD